jgi:hypothetical protein
MKPKTERTPEALDADGRKRLAHLVLWEEANGPVKRRHRIYFRNGRKTDVRLSNLGECTETEYGQRLAGATRVRGVWRKPCKHCHKAKRIDADSWYLRADGWPRGARCRACEGPVARAGIAKTRDKQAREPQPPT